MDHQTVAVLIPIVGIVFGIGIAAVSIIAAHQRKLQRYELRHKERLAAMEKGLELPPELAEPVEDERKSNGLRSGLIGVGVGAVLYFALRGVADEDVALFGLIPAAVGVAQLIYYFVEGRKA
jgi:uncharacterized protein (DUF697 family)